MRCIAASAAQAGLSISQFVRRVCLGLTVESRVDAQAVRELVKLNADMGRIGGLLKMWLASTDMHAGEVRALLDELKVLKDELARRIIRL